MHPKGCLQQDSLPSKLQATLADTFPGVFLLTDDRRCSGGLEMRRTLRVQHAWECVCTVCFLHCKAQKRRNVDTGYWSKSCPGTLEAQEEVLTRVLSLLADPLSVLAGCWWAAGGEEGDPGHYPVAPGAPRAAVTGSVPLWSAAVRASRDREDLAGKSCGNNVRHDIPEVRSVCGTDFLLAGDEYLLIGLLFSLPHSVKGPELINMYVGQSEENVRNGEDVHPAPARGEMGLFCCAAGKEVVLKPPFPTPTHSSQQGLEPSCLLQCLAATSPPALSAPAAPVPGVPDGTAAPQRHS